MAATQTVSQHPQQCNFMPITPQRGVVTLFGYGIKVHVDRGHLTIQDGVGAVRREARLSRVDHGLRRLVVIGSDGMVSLAALRWLADQDAAFVMLDRDGSVLATTGPVGPSDARLRRAQSLVPQSGAAAQIARHLISQKLAGQELLVRDVLRDSFIAQMIGSIRAALKTADTIQTIRLLEAQAAQAYWSAWRSLPINFPTTDLRWVPEHWRTFGTRKSPLTRSPRLAVNPPNAMLNYLYALLESEARLAAAALGLDPGIGILHVDTDARDSLACDLMEPVRPHVDAYLLEWITREPLRRKWFFEQRDGTCRLMGSFAVQLSESSLTWSRAVAPIAEWVSRMLWSTIRKPKRQWLPATHLTQSHRRQAKGASANPPKKSPPRPPRVCRVCGTAIISRHIYCGACATGVRAENVREAARVGRIAAQSADAQARRSDTQRRQAAAEQAWNPSELPVWLDKKCYRERIQPRLAGIMVRAIASRARRMLLRI